MKSEFIENANTRKFFDFWCLQCEISGGELSIEDREFVTKEEAAMTQDQRDRWQFEREYGNG